MTLIKIGPPLCEHQASPFDYRADPGYVVCAKCDEAVKVTHLLHRICVRLDELERSHSE